MTNQYNKMRGCFFFNFAQGISNITDFALGVFNIPISDQFYSRLFPLFHLNLYR